MSRMPRRFVFVAIGTLLLIAPIAAQETRQERPASPVQGPIEFGVRTFWGDVYGRPDLPFKPNLGTSKMNEYTDIRKNFLIRRVRIHLDDVLERPIYVNYQAQGAFYRNQSHLGSFGMWNKFKVQVRYDEIPHLFTNTART